MAKISIIIPLYFGEKYIQSLIDMFEENVRTLQNIAKIEVIFVKDSMEPWKHNNYTHSKFEIKIIYNSENKGIQYSRAAGIKAATGEYVHMLDQDDTIDDNFYVSQMLKIGKKDMVICNGIKEYDSYNKLLYRFHLLHLTVKVPFFYTYFSCRILSPGQCLIKRDCIPVVWLDNILKNSGADDFFLWLLLFQNKAKIAINREQIYRHVNTGENLSLNEDKMNSSLEEMVNFSYSLKCINKRWLKTIEKRQLCTSSKTIAFVTMIIEKINRERK